MNRDSTSLKKEPMTPIAYTTTIVTAFYSFKKAKHTQDSYNQWLANFLVYIDNPMVIFTCEKEVSFLHRLRNNLTNKTSSTVFILNFSSPLEMPPIKKLEIVFIRQFHKDPENALHSVDLYSIWCAKSYMLNLTSSLNPFRSNYFLWIDAGSFRNTKYRFRHWPDARRIKTIFHNNDRLLLGLISPLKERSCGFHTDQKHTVPNYDLIEGGILGGSSSVIQWWTEIFYEAIDEFIHMDEFIGKDQYIMNFIALTYPWKISVILAYKAFCGNNWFVYGPLLASDFERWILFGDNCGAKNIMELVRPLNEVCAQLL
ncbi:unnamed protein product [Rotaria magnacalcarata]|uniref:Uncharacterized protein n=1 Tax=Rotaria magnacalcarata TaxID=392030 RepID=A0A815EKD7_9BILA|nr:unnamed protein product [Rotaria magnacalcarata]CAF1453738.1 unnamed protein product [Rotaria magnacalcarata]CAF2046712.1 unnamed protein product [Rotaria magnacalcarata]CAF4559880.1 unnamed protein product [Rotaria magnacalcarata]CAF4681668.1 unnamed protein product [Rotaria magnacalcarata]